MWTDWDRFLGLALLGVGVGLGLALLGVGVGLLLSLNLTAAKILETITAR